MAPAFDHFRTATITTTLAESNTLRFAASAAVVLPIKTAEPQVQLHPIAMQSSATATAASGVSFPTTMRSTALAEVTETEALLVMPSGAATTGGHSTRVTIRESLAVLDMA